MPEGQSGGNYVYLAIMVALILIAVLANVLHPIAWTGEELRFAIGAPIALGGVVRSCTACRSGDAAAADHLGSIAADADRARVRGPPGRRGRCTSLFVRPRPATDSGRWRVPRTPDDPAAMLDPPADAPIGWLRLGAGWGLPAIWLVVGLLVIPVGLYVVSYIPWAMRREPPDRRGLAARATPARRCSTSLEMYDYHNNLRSAHPASSPWWAWAFDLKPVWFYEEGFAGQHLGLDLRRRQPRRVVARRARARLRLGRQHVKARAGMPSHHATRLPAS